MIKTIQLVCFHRTDPWASDKHDSSYSHERIEKLSSSTNFVYPLISTSRQWPGTYVYLPPWKSDVFALGLSPKKLVK